MSQLEMFDNEGEWLKKLRTNWGTAIEADGGFCPCCGKWGKVYKVKLSQHLALCLRWMYLRGDDDGWVDVQNSAPRWMLKSKTYPLLQHWKFLEPKSRRSGVWRITPEGTDFVRGLITAPSAVHIYDNSIWGYEDEDTSFRGCFDKHFDFDEMMSDQFNWANIRPKDEQ